MAEPHLLKKIKTKEMKTLVILTIDFEGAKLPETYCGIVDKDLSYLLAHDDNSGDSDVNFTDDISELLYNSEDKMHSFMKKGLVAMLNNTTKGVDYDTIIHFTEDPSGWVVNK